MLENIEQYMKLYAGLPDQLIFTVYNFPFH